MFVINRGGCFYPLVNKYNIFYFFFGRPEKENIGVSCLCGRFFLKSVLSIGCGRGTPENGGISPEWMQSGMF